MILAISILLGLAVLFDILIGDFDITTASALTLSVWHQNYILGIICCSVLSLYCLWFMFERED